jgi:NADPH2:quinone reductase
VKAVVCTKFTDDLSGLRYMDWPAREPQAGEVRVRLFGGGVNFADLLAISGKYQENVDPPFVLGTEGCGFIEQCGAGVAEFCEGDRVLIQNNVVRGCLADEVCVPAQRVAKVPDEVATVVAAGLPINWGTAYHALTNCGQVRAGEVLLVHGASGGVGLAAVQIGKALGATVIATGGDDGKLEIVRADGADHVVNYRTGNFIERVMEVTEGRGADCCYDPVGGDIFDASLKAIAYGGRMLVIGFASGRIPSARANHLLFNGISVIGAGLGGYTKRHPAKWAKMMGEILDMVSGGILHPRIYRTLHLSQAAEALRLVRERQVVGKCVLLSDYGMKTAV